MRTVAESIALLLCHDQALTIQKIEDGFILSLSDMEEREDDSLIFVPETVLVTPHLLEDALDHFYQQQQMYRLKATHA